MTNLPLCCSGRSPVLCSPCCCYASFSFFSPHPPRCRNDCSNNNTFSETVCSLGSLALFAVCRVWPQILRLGALGKHWWHFFLWGSTLPERSVGKREGFCWCEVNRFSPPCGYSERWQQRWWQRPRLRWRLLTVALNQALKAELKCARWGLSSGSCAMVRGPKSNWNIDPQQAWVGWGKLLNLQWVGGKAIKEQAEPQARLVNVKSSPAAWPESSHSSGPTGTHQD